MTKSRIGLAAIHLAGGRAALTPAIALWVLSASALAHHSNSAYDQARKVVVSGTVTKFEFVNPHSYVYFIAQGEKGGQQPWRCELSAVNALARLGWTRDTFSVGQKLTFKGAAARNEANVCALESFVTANGQEFGSKEDFTKGGGNPLATRARESTRAARTSGGRPNLAGPWLSGAFFARGRGAGAPPGGPAGAGPRRGGPGAPGGYQVTEAGAAASRGYDQPFDDPAIKCDIGNILFGWTHDGHVNEIIQSEREITLKYGYMDFVRTIHLDQAEHPRNLTPSRGGHSIGKWEGDVLVVDTVGFTPGVLQPISGVKHSIQLHVIERFTLDPAANTLTHEYTASDPLFLKAPVSGRDVSTLSLEPYVPYNCKELSGRNNIRAKS